jgi:hypothetical protein
MLRLLAEVADPAVSGGGDDAEARRLLERHAHRRHGDLGAPLAVEGDHLAHVHAVDVVGGEYRDDVRGMGAQQVEVLVDRIRRALELAA